MVTAGCCLLVILSPGPVSVEQAVRAWPPSRPATLLAQTDASAETGRNKPGKLDRQVKIELMLVLVMLVAVGLCLIAFTWYAARMTRRYMKPAEKLPARRLDPVFTDDWAAKPLTAEEQAKLDNPEW